MTFRFTLAGNRSNPETRTAWLDALAVAVNAGLFNEGTRQQSQLFSFSDAGRVIRWDKKSLATFQQATDVAAHQLKLDRDKYRLQRLESLAKGAWMPRRFIARWLTEYCKLSRLPWWLEDEAPDDLRGELERVHAAYVDVNGKDEWDGFREPCWTHVQTIIWRVTRDPAAVDKASTDSNRPSLGDTYAKCVGAAVIEIWRLNIGEVKDAARELRRLCLAGEMTAYDRSGVPIDKMSWLSLEIVLDNEKMLWIMRDGQPVGDVVFRRDDVLGVWPELHARRAAVQPEAITAIEPAGQDIAEAEDLNAAPGQITVHEALERVARMICTQLGDEWIPELTPKEKWALRPWTNDPSSPVRVLNIADFQPSPDLVARAREKNGWKREQRQRALFWLQDRGLLPATTSLSPTKSTFIDRAAFERIFKAEFGERFGNKVVPPHPSEPDSPTSEPPQDHDGAIDTEPDAELKQAPNAKVREAIRAEYKEAKDKEQKPPNIKELPPLIQNRLKAIGFRASQSNIAKIGGEAEFDKLRIKQGQKWTGRKPD